MIVLNVFSFWFIVYSNKCVLCLLTKAKQSYCTCARNSQKYFKPLRFLYIGSAKHNFHQHSFQLLLTFSPINSYAHSAVIQHLSIKPCNQEKQIT